MKNKKILIVLIVLIILIAGWFIYNLLTKKEENNIIETVEISEKIQNLFSKLLEEGNELYENNDYLNFDKRDDIYFISLNELKEKYNYDISDFTDENGNICDVDNSGIYFDIDYKIHEKIDIESFVVPSLYGCGVTENESEENNSDVVINKNQYKVNIAESVTAIFTYEEDKITNYFEYYDNSIDFDVFKDSNKDLEYVKSITQVGNFYVIEYEIDYVINTYGADTLSGIKAYFADE